MHLPMAVYKALRAEASREQDAVLTGRKERHKHREHDIVLVGTELLRYVLGRGAELFARGRGPFLSL